MAGPVQRRKAGDEANDIWESGKLVSNPDTEEEWAAWNEFNDLVKKADGKGLTDAEERQYKGGYEGARGNYRDYVYDTHYKDAGWTREQFDEAREKFAGGPAAGLFRSGQLGTDFESVNTLGDTAATSETLGEFRAKVDAEEAAGQFDGIELPDFEKLDPSHLSQGDQLELQSVTLGDAGDSNWADFQGQDSIDYFRDIMDGGGKDAVSEAEFAQKRAQAEQADRAQREATMRSAEVQGLSGSGVELAADLAGQQDRTSALYQGGLSAAAMAQDRRDAAGNAVYGMEGDKANAMDAWGMWDTNRHDTEAIANTSLANEAERFNTGRANFVSDSNVGIDNSAQAYNTGAGQQQFANEMGLAAAKSGAGFNLGNFNLGADQFNQNMDWSKYQFDESQPGALETMMSVLGGTAAAATGAGQLYGAFNPKKGP